MLPELEKVKKIYGENFAKICRELFPTILEKPGTLLDILREKIDNVPTIYEDIITSSKDPNIAKNNFRN